MTEVTNTEEFKLIISKQQEELLSKHDFTVFEVSNAHLLRELIGATQLTVFDLVEYFNGNYIVQNEPEDLLIQTVNEISQKEELEDYDLGYLSGISYVLNLYDIEIEGVNIKRVVMEELWCL